MLLITIIVINEEKQTKQCDRSLIWTKKKDEKYLCVLAVTLVQLTSPKILVPTKRVLSLYLHMYFPLKCYILQA